MDNAAPLCFDCHMYAGSDYYSQKHPRGTKYTIAEIKRARNRLYDDVAHGRIPSGPVEPYLLSVRYILVRDFGIALEVARGDAMSLPLDVPTGVVKNEVSAFYASLSSTAGPWRRTSFHLNEWSSREDYLTSRPTAIPRVNAKNTAFPVYDFVRAPAESELELARSDAATALLLDAGVSADEAFLILGWRGGCDGRFHEEVRLRDVIPILLCLTNVGDRPVSLSLLDNFHLHPEPTPYSIAEAYGSTGAGYVLPRAAVDPGTAVIIPSATVIAPLDSSDSWPAIDAGHLEVPKDPYPLRVRLKLNESLTVASGHVLIGPSILPTHVEYDVLGTRRSMPVHQLDPERTYTLSASFEVGSCPYLFVQSSGVWRFQAEVCTGTDGRSSVVSCAAEEATSIAVVELDDQYACIESVLADGAEILTESVTLRPGDAWITNIHASSVRVYGYHIARQPRNMEEESHRAATANLSVQLALRQLAASDLAEGVVTLLAGPFPRPATTGLPLW